MRVKLLLILALAVLVVLSFGWSVYATPEEYYKATGKRITQYKESPMLTELVKQGKLPPVEQRLPEEPLVIVPEEEVGQFGGTWRRVWKGLGDRWGIFKLAEPHLVYWSADGGEFLPGLAKSWEILENGRIFIFHLRKGVKWSDGHPYTVDDIIFWVEDLVGNDDITPTKPAWYRHGGQTVKVEKIDDYTIKFEFAAPNALFMLQVAYSTGFTGAPKHYLKQFHPKYTPMSEIEKVMAQEKQDTWVNLFNLKNDPIRNLELPVLWTWKAASDPSGQFFIMERNPYFWAVDIEGNQLPYIDYVRHEYVMSDEMILLKAIAGEIDMQHRHIGMLGAGAGNYTLLKENEKKGDYRVLNWITANGSVSQLMFNPNHQDPVLRELFNNKKFRQALSLAIDREEISEVLFNGMAKPRQASFVSGSAYYDPLWEKAYAEYDVKKANQLLDELGLKWDAKKEYRLRPDGKPLQFTIQVTRQVDVDVWTMVKEHWKKIGIKVEVQSLERSLYESKIGSGDYDAQVWSMDRAVIPQAEPVWVIPGSTTYAAAWWAAWGSWIDAYKKGEQPPADAAVPPEDVIKLVDLWEQAKKETDPAKFKQIMAEITKIHRENIWMIGTVGEDIAPVVVKNNFKNVPAKIVSDDILRTYINAMPMQFFIKQK
ncbi:ABC transporter substrate-binding protein [Pseudothermotoga thermarum]|uniref:Extracellular solute-binding protein family 5 n=1 Tax=Pseudothermotoga thermarum DSM 5069 TaxID=688269 RepID=F7YUS0_9THEM|nr:ABC transporter substrate-binding protein [Pseudothermotoga thermarum]AEH50257.1 extracellular solute-binding protein family 5 [Pseudothermotoga thermarum DSM 5069]